MAVRRQRLSAARPFDCQYFWLSDAVTVCGWPTDEELTVSDADVTSRNRVQKVNGTVRPLAS
jgi:hypothetical protein